ncbi:MAG: hypothetical protein H6947_15120 [Zoogloeaceae bacterium]|nr:hypothetical protein [Zoogloeaceae bacterium]
MSKILVVGHPQSGYEGVEELLSACGMGAAQPSRRDGYTPQQINAMLCKAHGTPKLTSVTSEADIQQIGTAPVWQGLALDLMLGNLEENFWGWSDPNAIYLLDYWKQLDPTVKFVFVYGSPETALIESDGDAQADDIASLGRRLQNWKGFNEAMLYFYNRNQDRSVLVHAQQARLSVAASLQQLRTRLNAPVMDPPVELHLLDTAKSGSTEPSPSAVTSGAPMYAVKEVYEGRVRSTHAGSEMQTDALGAYLANQIVRLYPDVCEVFEELQSVANLARDPNAFEPCSARLAWGAMLERDRFRLTQERELRDKARALADARQHISDAVRARADLSKDLEQNKELLIRAEARYASLKAESDRCSEQALASKQEVESKAKDLLAKLEAAKDELGQLSSEKQNLLTELEKFPRQLDVLREENSNLLSELHQAQEDLERIYLETQQLKNLRPPPEPPRPYGAAERVRQELNYRLGAIMVQGSRSMVGLLRMPWALRAEMRSFRNERRESPHGGLAPLDSYMDVHEAERVKQHLSYRLGSTLLNCVNSPLGWVKLPFAVRREVREFRQQRQGRAK